MDPATLRQSCARIRHGWFDNRVAFLGASGLVRAHGSGARWDEVAGAHYETLSLLKEVATSCVDASSPVQVFRAAGMDMTVEEAESVADHHITSSGIVAVAEDLEDCTRRLEQALEHMRLAWVSADEADVHTTAASFVEAALAVHRSVGQLVAILET